MSLFITTIKSIMFMIIIIYSCFNLFGKRGEGVGGEGRGGREGGRGVPDWKGRESFFLWSREVFQCFKVFESLSRCRP